MAKEADDLGRVDRPLAQCEVALRPWEADAIRERRDRGELLPNVPRAPAPARSGFRAIRREHAHRAAHVLVTMERPAPIRSVPKHVCVGYAADRNLNP